MASYVPLWCKSNFSFLEGASHPEELVEQAHHLGLRALALTDRDGVYGAVRAHLKARELGLHLILGAEVTVDGGASVVLLVKDRPGWASLCRLLTTGRLRCEKGRAQVRWDEVCSHAAGLIALWRGGGDLEALQRAFGRDLYALLARHRHDEEVAAEARLRALAARHGVPVVAASEVLYHTLARRPLQDVLTCIRQGVTLATAGRRTKPNAEHGLCAPPAFATLFSDDVDAVARTEEIAARCSFSLAELRYRYPSERLPDGATSTQWLRELTFAGARRRYGDDPDLRNGGRLATLATRPRFTQRGRARGGDPIPPAVRTQLERELEVIDRLDYPGYFLTMYEVVQLCRARGILCQGRGSAANSAVCYCLGITAIDPVRMGLLFERFLSEERAEPPDIDLDIEHSRREEVIQWMYEKYGRERAAMVAVVIRYRTRSAIREVAKAFGLPATAVDRLARLHSHYEALDPATLAQAGLDLDEPQRTLYLSLVNELLDFPRHLSIHPGGFLLGHEPVCELVPIENGTMEERTVIQWDKDDVEALGLFKVDLLGLGALHMLHLAFDLLEEHRGLQLSMATIPPADEATYDMICRADTVGTFQIESRAQMAMLPRLRPRSFYDLVIEVSIVRPGPITGGMVHPYLRRRRGQEAVEYPHPCLEPVLAKTLGVPIFQEQVMKLAVVAADYTPGEADQLRRDMAAWRKAGRIERHRHRLISRMEHKGIKREFAERVFDQIRGFGEYGFPESHAASFALIGYATAYLKRHFPAEFFCALLNAQPMGFYAPSTLVETAKRCGVAVRPVDARSSGWDCTLELLEGASALCPPGCAPDDDVPFALRMGLRYVKGLGQADGDRIARARAQAAPPDLDRFVTTSGLDEGALVALAEAGALEGFGLDRRQALWEVRRLVRERGAPLALPSREALPRFAPLDALETVGWDYRSSWHSARGHPLESLRPELERQGLPDAASVNAMAHGRRVRYAGLVICRQRPGTASGVVFMTLEDESGFVNVVVWRKTYERFRLLVKGEPFLGVSGTLQKEQGTVHLIARQLWVPRLEQRPARVESRDFH